MPQTFIQRLPDSRRLRQPIVGFPSQQIRLELVDDLRHAASARASGQLPDPSLERRHQFGCHLAFYLVLDTLDALAQKPSSRQIGHRAFGLIDLEL